MKTSLWSNFDKNMLCQPITPERVTVLMSSFSLRFVDKLSKLTFALKHTNKYVIVNPSVFQSACSGNGTDTFDFSPQERTYGFVNEFAYIGKKTLTRILRFGDYSTAAAATAAAAEAEAMMKTTNAESHALICTITTEANPQSHRSRLAP